jgi:hypothetical protein
MHNDLAIDNIHEKINETVEEFYTANGKNIIFKSRQKKDCADYISNIYDMDDLLSNTIYMIPGKPYVYIDYTLLKLYINDDNYVHMIRKYQETFEECYSKNNHIEVHLNLDSFTISAAQRYKTYIETFANECMINGNGYSTLLSKFVIYNSPSMIDNIFIIVKHIVDKRLLNKIEIVNKKESAIRLRELFQCVYNDRNHESNIHP